MRVSVLLPLSAAALFLVTAPARALRYDIDAQHSEVVAEVNFFGLAHRSARFPTLHGGITLDPAHPDSVGLDVEIDARALIAPDPVTLSRLRGPHFLDVERYPTIRFTGHRLTLTGDRSGTVDGELTARGVSHPATLAVTFSQPPRTATPRTVNELKVTTTVDRGQYGMTAYRLIVGGAVTIRIAARMVADR